MPLRARALLVIGALASCGRFEFAVLPDAAPPVIEPTCPAGGCVVTHGWSKRFGSPAVDFGFDLAYSVVAHRIYLTGFYAGSVDFGAGPLPSAGLHDVMVALFDEDGGVVSTRGYGGPGFEEGLGISVATNGDIYLTGSAQDQAQFLGPPLTGSGDIDVFAARFTQLGGHLWSALRGGTGDDRAAELTIDDDGASYLVGGFQQAASFGGAVRTSRGVRDGFVVSYNATGGYRWDRAWGSAADDLARSIAIDAATRTLYVSGHFTGTVDFGTGAITARGGLDGFLVGLDADTGTTRWTLTWGSAADDGSNGVTVDRMGNAYVAAHFSETIVLGDVTLTSAGNEDLALFSATPTGEVRWATRHGGPATDRGVRLAIGPNGEVVVGGLFGQTATLGGEIVTSQGDSDAFLLTTTASGTPLWARAFGSTGLDELQGVAIDDRGRVFATGAFSTSISFGGPVLTSAGSLDTFLVRLDPEIVVPAP